jgi:NAD(P)-dependent dehydrogenase (short-subunit alcohol dehydrogenase family)
MNETLTGQHVVIIGGSSHMGLATAMSAKLAGAKVTLLARDAERLKQAAQSIGEGVVTMRVDASSEVELAATLQKLGSIDHLMVTVSAKVPAGGIANTSVETAKLAFERLWISYRVVQLALKYLQPNGSVTLLSGSSGRRPVRGYAVWTALHGAIEALAKGAMLEIAPRRLNVISPGGIGMRPDRQLIARAGEAKDVASMAIALMSNPAITGAVVDVDSGERLGS